jgi:hypothetical protein
MTKVDIKKAVTLMEGVDVTELEDFSMKPYIQPADHYLVYLKNSTWIGASGFRIVSDVEETIQRGYDCSVYFKDSISDGRVLVCKEFHHDSPMGHPSYIVALTTDEYYNLISKNESVVFDYIELMLKSLGAMK